MKRSVWWAPYRDAGVPVEAGIGEAADAAHDRHVLRLAAEAGREAAGEPLVERKAVRIRRDRRERAAVGDVADDRHRRAAAGAGHPRLGPQPVAHQQRAAAVRAEDAAPRMRVAEEEAAGDALARIVRVRVGLHAGGPRIADVAEQLQVVVDLRRAPDLRHLRHDVRIPRGEQRDGVAAGGTPVCGIRAAVFQAEVDEARGAKRQADVAGHGERLAVAFPERAGVEGEAAARRGILELEIQDAGDGVRAVLRRGAAAQDLNLPQRDGRDGGNVRPLRAVRHAVAAVPVDDRRAVAALAVHQDKRVVRRQVAQHRRPDNRRRVADRLRVDIERRDDGAQLVWQIDGALVGQIRGRQHVDRHRRCGDGPRLTARPDDDGLLRESVEQDLQLVRRQAQRPDVLDRHAERVAERFVLFVRQVVLIPEGGHGAHRRRDRPRQGIVKLSRIRLTDPQDDGLKSRRERGMLGVDHRDAA